VTLDQRRQYPPHIDEPDAADDPEALSSQWAEIHQATGMVSAQLDVGMAIALECLRAHASTTERPLADVAADVVARRLRLTDS
jgi:hypothetical protein